jgi:hypothetical protein
MRKCKIAEDAPRRQGIKHDLFPLRVLVKLNRALKHEKYPVCIMYLNIHNGARGVPPDMPETRTFFPGFGREVAQ